MAEDKTDTRESTWRHLFPWTELFRCFKVAVDPNKLLLAAAGILLMATGWVLFSTLFGAAYKEVPPQPTAGAESGAPEDWKNFKAARDSWNLMHEAANIGKGNQQWDVDDLAESPDELKRLRAIKTEYKGTLPKDALEKAGFGEARAKYLSEIFGKTKRHGTLSTWPWAEDRGPNPYLMVTGQVRGLWEPGHFWDWFTGTQLPVMFEPLVKIVRPIVYYFSPRSDTYTRFYFLFVTLWTVVIWSIFGGAITRIAAVEVARGEKIGLGEAIRFTSRRWLSYLSAPLFPLLFVFFLLVLTVIYGLFFMIPFIGDVFVAGLFWWVPLLFGLGMACTLIGLAVGWPLMAPTISTEGTDSWEAVSRSFSYVFQRPWHYIWYSLVGACYGAIAIFFIGFMGSFTIYLAKWGVNQTPFVSAVGRDPSFLFVYSPTSFDWQTLLLQGATTVDGDKIVRDGVIDPTAYGKYVDTLWVYNKIGALLVAFWLGLAFLMLIGFGYSFFFSMSTIIYLLMRRHVDSAELDEVYLEEDDAESVPGGFPAPPPAPPAPAPKPTSGLTMVESPSLRAPAPPPPAPVAPPAPPPTSLATTTAPDTSAKSEDGKPTTESN